MTNPELLQPITETRAGDEQRPVKNETVPAHPESLIDISAKRTVAKYLSAARNVKQMLTENTIGPARYEELIQQINVLAAKDIGHELIRSLEFMSEDKGLDYLENVLEENLDKEETIKDIASGLAGLDSLRAQKLREKLAGMDIIGIETKVVRSLAGVDTQEAWQMRDRYRKSKDFNQHYLIHSLGGLDTDKAWAVRDEFRDSVHPGYMAQSLVGIDTPRAWKERWEIFDKLISASLIDVDRLAQSLSGLDSDEAWRMREELLKYPPGNYAIMSGLAGLESDRAWKMRDEQPDHTYLGISIAGCTSERSWELREKLFHSKNSFGEDDIDLFLPYSLAGLDSERAWQMREKLSSGKKAQSIFAADSLANPRVFFRNSLFFD